MDGCIEWQGARDPNGYGRLTIQRHSLYAHRWTWEQAYGAIPKGLCVCHKCDNPSCINLDHLWLGTHQENMADSSSKGRARGGRHGMQHGLHKLTDEQVREIRTSTDTQTTLAKRYGVSQSAVSAIRTGKTWRHVS